MAEISAQAHAAILLRVAAKAVVEARHAWQLMRPGDVGSLRSAYRACILAVQASRRAAAAWTHDASEYRRLTAETRRLIASAADLKDRLVRAHHEAEVPPPR